MTNTVLIKRSSTANAVPLAGNLQAGELAINYNDGNLFYKNASNVVTVIASNKFTSVSGNVTGGNIVTGGVVTATGNVTGGNLLSSGAISAASTVTAAGITSTGVINFTGTSNVSLGNLANIHIPGGSANYVISTDGAGNLSWVAQTGGGGGNSVITVDDFTGNGVQTQFTLSVTPPNINSTTVNYNGIIQLRTGYTLSGANIVFSTAPANGSSIEVTTISSVGVTTVTPAGSNTQVQFNDGGALGASSAFTFDKSSNTLNATNVTANGAPLATTGKAIAMAIVFGF